MADQTLQVKIEGDLKNLQAALTQAKTQVGQFENTVENNSKKVNKSFNQMESFAKGALGGIAAAFSVGAIINFGKAIISTTAEFQKMEAVLTNTLGSNSAARVAMDELSSFAARTPFSVNELTASFVKLANQGFTPTLRELTSLGDLASSTGKSFDQLTEAILDAQVGEFERLKEFGVRAAKEGDNVTFTFKGVETQVKATDSAIREYVLGLGEAEGVTGSMAAISETVGGKISNLGDNFTQLQKEIGDGSSGLIAGVLDLANAMTSQLVTSMNAVNTIARKTGESGFVSFFKQISALVNPAYAQSLEIQAKVIKAIDKASLDTADSIETVTDEVVDLDKALKEFNKQADDFNRQFFLNGKINAEAFNSALKETLRIQNAVASGSQNILESQTTGPTINGFPVIELPPIDTKAFEESVSKADQAVIDANSLLVQRAKDFAMQFENSLKSISMNFLVEGITESMFAIGEALTAGAENVTSVGDVLLNGISGFLSQLGKEMVAYGVAALAMAILTQALLNPITSIPAALGLIAAGAALSLAGGAIKGTLNRGSSSAGGSSSMGASAMAYSGSGLNSGYNAMSDVEFRLRGTDLVGSIKATEKKQNRG